MEAFWGTAGMASAASAAMGVFGYNRDAWMVNVQVNQARRFQKQQVVLSQAGMFRDDIRQMIGSALLRQSNYVVVGTLVLGVIGTYYIQGTVPKSTPAYLTAVYKTCIGCSLLYLSLSVLCAMRGNHVAAECQRDMLTTLVRLPVQELAEDIDRAAPGESIQAFEKQGLSRMLRVPGASRLTGGGSSSSRRRSSSPARGLAASESSQAESDQARLQDELDREMQHHSSFVEHMNEQRKRYLAIFKVKEQEWAALSRYSVHFGILGLHHLIQAMAYYTVAKYSLTKTADWCAFLVQFMFSLVDAMLSLSFNRYTEGSCCGGFLWVVSVVGSQAFLFNATRSDHVQHEQMVDAICIPGVFACHLLVNLLGAYRIMCLPRPQPVVLADAVASEEYEGMALSSGDESMQPSGKARFLGGAGLTCIFGIAITGWLFCLCWAVPASKHPVKLLGEDEAEARRLGEPPGLALQGLALDCSSASCSLDRDSGRLSEALRVEMVGSRQFREGIEDRLMRLDAALRERQATRGKSLLKEAMVGLLESNDLGAGRGALVSSGSPGEG